MYESYALKSKQVFGGAVAKPIRVAHLVSHPIQYFAPLYRNLARRPEIDLTVYFYSDSTLRQFVDKEFGRSIKWDVPLTEGYKHRIVASARTREIGGAAANPDLLAELIRERYDAIWVHGYMSVNAWAARLIAALTGAAFLIREEQTLLDFRPLTKRVVKQLALRPLLWRSWALSIGQQNRDYFRHYGVPPERIFGARYSVDNDFFRRGAEGLAPQRAEIRHSLGITDDKPVILFCGKFIEKKQPLLLLEAFEQLSRKHECWLLMVGDGALRAKAAELVESRNIPRVLFAGFMNQTELPRAYTAADIFVLPSAFQETWGLVVNEAMNYGLPVVVSDRVGCGRDLVEHGRNGFIFPYNDAALLAQSLEPLVADLNLCKEFGRRGLARVSEYSIDACAEAIVSACVTSTR